MRGLRLDRVLAGTALALVQVGLLASGNFDARAQSPAADRKEIEALVPLPDAADVPPPTFGDFSRVPLPDPVPVGAIVAPAPAQPAEGPAAGSTATASPPPATEPPAAEAKEPPKEPAKPVFAVDLSPADRAIAEKLRDLLTAKNDRIFDRKKERAAVEAFYAGRGYAPIWIADGLANDRAKATIARLKAADTDGLEPSDYPTPDFKAAAERPEALAEAELRLVNSVLTYARHAQTGRVHYSHVSADIYYEQVFP